jgi:hypothetical protein
MLYRKAETVKRRMSGAQAVGVVVDIAIPNRRRDQTVARNVIGSSARKLIRCFDNVIVAFEQR